MKEFVVENSRHHPTAEIFFGEKTPHMEVPSRVQEIESALRKMSGSEIVLPKDFQEMPLDLLNEVHSRSYIDFILRSRGRAGNSYRYPSTIPYRSGNHKSTHKIGEMGYYSSDLYTPINRFTGSSALLSAEAAYNAALTVLMGDDQEVAYSVARPPGHHAGSDYMGGYCYFNNAALAAAFLSEHSKVAILDVDFHHGNGTEDIFKESQARSGNPQVFYSSIHAHPDRMFPYYSGVKNSYSTEGKQLSDNYPLGSGVKNREYDRTLDKALQRIAGFGAEYLVVSLGFDTYKDDPICDFSLTTDYYEEMARNIMGLKLPTVLIQEGGYRVDAIGANAASFVKGVLKSI